MKKMNLADIVSNEFYEFVDRYVKGRHKKRDKDILTATVGVLECTPHIVRCYDCRFAHLTYDGMCKQCEKATDDEDNMLTLYLPGDFFCGYGELKGGDGE